MMAGRARPHLPAVRVGVPGKAWARLSPGRGACHACRLLRRLLAAIEPAVAKVVQRILAWLHSPAALGEVGCPYARRGKLEHPVGPVEVLRLDAGPLHSLELSVSPIAVLVGKHLT